MADSVRLTIELDPKLNKGELLNIAKTVKSTLGEAAAGGVKFDTGNLNKQIQDSTVAAAGLSKAFNFNMMMDATQNLANSFSMITDVSMQFESSLAAVGAITGMSGEGLEDLGSRARSLAVQFGTSATSQLESFQGILSKFGPQVAEDSAALEIMARNVNILSAASGDDAKASMAALTDGMLQFGLVTGNAQTDAATMTRLTNDLAASAQVGAAEIPQVATAILQAGVAAKGAKMDFVETNAAIQVMALGGKTGAEAGTALRNVLGLMQNASGPAEQAMKKLGTSSAELGKILTTEGLDKALIELKGGMDKVGSASEKNALLMDIFGTENSAAAGIMLDNVDKYKEFVDGIRAGENGVGAAFEQAAQRMDTGASVMARGKAMVEDAFISIGSAIGSTATGLLGLGNQLAPTMVAFSTIGATASKFGLQLLSKVVPSLVVSDVATKSLALNTSALNMASLRAAAGEAIHSGAKLASAAATGVATAATWLWNAALNANPIAIIIAGIAGAIIAVKALAAAFTTTAAERKQAIVDEGLLLGEQIKTTKEQETQASKRAVLLQTYERLGSTVNKTAEQQKEFNESQIRVAQEFPGLIKKGQDFSASLSAVQSEVKKATAEAKNYADEARQLESKRIELNVQLKRVEVDVQKTDIEDQLTEAFKDVSPQWDSGSEWLFGTSDARKMAEDAVKQYTDGIYQASTGADVDKAAQAFKLAMYNDKKFEGLDPKIKANVLKQIDEMGAAQKDAIKASQAQAADVLKLSVNDALTRGVGIAPDVIKKVAAQTGRPVSELKDQLVSAFAESTKEGGATEAQIESLAKSIGKTKEETRDMLLAKALADASQKGALTADAVAGIAAKFGASKDKAAALYAEQQKQTAEAKKTADAVADIGKQYDENKKKLQDDLDYNKKRLIALETLKKTQGSLTEAQQKEFDERLAWGKADADQLKGLNATEAKYDELLKTTVDKKKESKKETETAYELMKKANEEAKRERDLVLKNSEANTKAAALAQGRLLSEKERRQLELDSSQSRIDNLRKEQEEIAKLKDEALKTTDKKKQADQIAEAKRLAEEISAAILEEENKRKEQVINFRISDEQAALEFARIRRENDGMAIEVQLKAGTISKSEAFGRQLDLIREEINEKQTELRTSVTIDDNARAKLLSEIAKLQIEAGNKEAEISDAQEIERIGRIKDVAEQTREIKLLEARKTYAADLAAAEGNEAAKYEAMLKYQKAKKAAEDDYVNQTSNKFARLIQNLNASAANLNLSFDNSEENKKQYDENKKALANDRDELEKSLKKKEVSTKEYLQRTQELNARAEEIEAQRAGRFAINWKAALSAVGDSFKQLSDDSYKDFGKAQDNLLVLAQESEDRKVKIAQLSSRQKDAILHKDLATAINLQQQIKDLGDQETAAATKKNAIISKSYEDLGVAVGSAFVGMLADGENLWKALAKAAIAGLRALVPIWIAQQFGLYSTSPNPVNIFGLGVPGAVAAGVASAALLGLLSIAEAGVNGFQKGGPTGPGSDNEVKGVVHANEFVWNAKTTAANREMLEAVHKGGLTPAEYYSKKFAGDVQTLIDSELMKAEIVIRAETATIAAKQSAELSQIAALQTQTIAELQELKRINEEGNYSRQTNNQLEVRIKPDTKQYIKNYDISIRKTLKRR